MDAKALMTEYSDLAALMRQMLVTAEKQDWDQLLLLEKMHSAKMQKIRMQESSIMLSVTLLAEKKRLIEDILSHEQKLKLLIRPRMEVLLQLMQGVKQKSKLDYAYGV
jgi:hypothetical protein